MRISKWRMGKCVIAGGRIVVYGGRFVRGVDCLDWSLRVLQWMGGQREI